MLIVAVACSVQASAGFGANLLAIPLLVQIDTELVPGPMLAASFVLNALMLLRDRQAVSLAAVGSAVAGRIPGTVLGVVALFYLSERGLEFVVVAVVLGIVGVSAVGRAPKRSSSTLFGAGVISGFTASTAGIGGPPVALVLQDAPGPEIRGSMGGFFVLGSVITISGLALSGNFGLRELQLAVTLVPGAIAGFIASRWLVGPLDRGYTRAAVLTLSSIAALALLARLLL